MNLTCREGYSRISEFTQHEECVVPIVAKRVLRVVSIVLGCITLLVSLGLVLRRFQYLRTKNTITHALVAWGLFHIPFMTLRSVFNLFLDAHSVSNLWMAIFVHVNGASSALFVTFLAYFFLYTVSSGSLKKSTILCGEYKGRVFLTVGSFVTFFFLLGPFIYHYTNVEGAVVIWGTILIADLLLITMLAFFGLLLYFKIQKMISDKYQKLGRDLLMTVIFCASVGLTTGGMCVFSMFNPDYEWVIVDLVWNSNIIFVLCLLFFLTRAKEESKEKSSTDEVVSQNQSQE